MKKVTAFVGSARKKHTYDAVVRFLGHLQSLGDVACEIVTLSDYTLKPCRGCASCIEKGEEFCPLKDDRDVLMDKIMASDGVVFASPNYCGDVSGILKMFIDRFVFACHRPRYFGKVCTSIVTQSITGGARIVEYLDTFAMALGFNVVKGTCITPPDPMTEKRQQKIDRALAAQATQFYAGLARPFYPAPTLLKLMIFRISRRTIHDVFDDRNRDHRYYAEKGWFASDYYYPTRLGPLKKAAGHLIDAMAPRLREMMA